jgi:hypothetical protein
LQRDRQALSDQVGLGVELSVLWGRLRESVAAAHELSKLVEQARDFVFFHGC